MNHETLITDLPEDTDLDYETFDEPLKEFVENTEKQKKVFVDSKKTSEKTTERSYCGYFDKSDVYTFVQIVFAVFIGISFPIDDYLIKSPLEKLLNFGMTPVRSVFIAILFFVVRMLFRIML